MRVKFLTLLAALAVTLIPGIAAAQGQYPSGSTGTDVSWPNCSSSIPKTAFGIVGINDGKGFSTNPCLQKEAGHFLNLSLYVNTGYPGPGYGLKYQNYPQACAATD